MLDISAGARTFDIKKPDPADPDTHLRAHVKAFDEAFVGRSRLLLSQASAWFVLASPVYRHAFVTRQTRADPGGEGQYLAERAFPRPRASYLAKSMLVFHANLQTPLTRNMVVEVGKLVEVLKGIEFTVLRKTKLQEALVHSLRGVYENILSQVAL